MNYLLSLESEEDPESFILKSIGLSCSSDRVGDESDLGDDVDPAPDVSPAILIPPVEDAPELEAAAA